MAGVELATGYISLVPSAKGFRAAIEKDLGSDLDSAGKEQGEKLGRGMTAGFSSKLKGFAVAGAAAGAAVAVAFGKSSIDAASDLGESTSKVGVVFGEAASKVLAFSDTTSKALGISKGDALAAAGTFGNLAVSLKLPQDKAADMSTNLVKLAADMASFNNVPVEDALAALKSGLVGETEPLRAFGVNLNDAALQAKALELGLGDGKTTLSAAAKAQASYALILEQSTTAQGDFARTSGGLANQKKILAAQTEELQVKIGEKLLPAMLKATTAGLKVVEWVSNLSPGTVKLIGVIAGFVAVMFTIVKVTQAWTAVQAAFNVVMALNPVVLIVLAIIALVAAVILAYQKVEWFRDFVDAAFRLIGAVVGAVVGFIRDNWKTLLLILTGPIGVAVLLITKNWDTIKAGFTAVVNWIGDKIGAVVGFFVAWHRRSVEIVGAIWGFIRDGAANAINWVRDRFNDIVNFVTGLPGRIGNAARGMFDSIRDAFKGVINGIIGIWNRLDFGISISVPDWVPGIGGRGFRVDDIFPDIPQFATGGVVPGPVGQPVLAVVHGGEEVLTPRQRTGAGVAVNQTIYAGPGQDERLIGNIAGRRLGFELRTAPA